VNTLDIRPKSLDHISLATITFGLLSIWNAYSYQMIKLDNIFTNSDLDATNEKRKCILYLRITTQQLISFALHNTVTNKVSLHHFAD
jgi:hypothetical protein